MSTERWQSLVQKLQTNTLSPAEAQELKGAMLELEQEAKEKNDLALILVIGLGLGLLAPALGKK